MKFHTILCPITLCLAQTTFAATLYTGADLSSVTSGSISDYQNNPANHVAAKFTLTETSSDLKAASFYGFYNGGNDNPLSVTTDLFDVVFFSDAGNGPGSVIGSAQTSLVGHRETTGSFILGHNIFRYELNFASTVTLAANNYWIAISRNNPTAPAGTGATWMWAGDHTGVPALQSQGPNQFSLSGTDNASPAFTLENTQFAVPEPSSFMFGLLALATTMTRRKR